MRKIVRPGFPGKNHIETVYIEEAYHVIQDTEELDNVLLGISEDDIFRVGQFIDTKTFNPVVYFAIRKEGKLFSEWLKYCVTLQLFMEKHEKVAAKTDG